MRLQVFPVLYSQGLCWIWSCLPPHAPPGTQHPNPAETAPQSPSNKSWGTQFPHRGRRRGWWGLSSGGGCLPIPSSRGNAVSSPSPAGVHTGQEELLPPHRWRQHLPQLAKIKLLSLEKAAGAGQSSPRQPCHPSTPKAAEPARPTAGHHGGSILPGK